MKLRIIERGDGTFEVQEKNLFEWTTVSTYVEDYDPLDSYQRRDNYIKGNFPTLEMAKKKLNRIIKELEDKKSRKKFKVIEKVTL